MSIREKLIINNFFSIKNFEWDIKGFNILTGGMASGKSLALKLLYFCEQVFKLTVYDATISKELFQKENFFRKINEEFNKIFISKDHESDYSATVINYSYEFYESLPKNQSEFIFNEEILPEEHLKLLFDLSAIWDKTELRWSSKYIESRLETWQAIFYEKNSPELTEKVRNRVFKTISSNFSNSFPLDAMFIPASRAIAAITSTIESRDIFIRKFIILKEFALSFNNEIGGISSERVNKLLRLQNISLDEENNKQPVFKLLNGRDINSLELSSGQQELLYLLLLIHDLKRPGFEYGYNASIFIEEPSAHLFPREQKETIEFLVSSFNELKSIWGNSPGHRFFISTHSPYLLNAFNNCIEKDRLLKIAKNMDDTTEKNAIIKKVEELSFPCLPIDNVSAYMIENEGNVKPMINRDDDEPYIYSEIIDLISQEITEGTEKLYDINSEIRKLSQYTSPKVN